MRISRLVLTRVSSKEAALAVVSSYSLTIGDSVLLTTGEDASSIGYLLWYFTSNWTSSFSNDSGI